MEASKSHERVVQVASFWPSTHEQRGLPQDWFITSNDGCDMMVMDKLTYTLQYGEDACGVTGIRVYHWKKDKGCFTWINVVWYKLLHHRPCWH